MSSFLESLPYSQMPEPFENTTKLQLIVFNSIHFFLWGLRFILLIIQFYKIKTDIKRHDAFNYPIDKLTFITRVATIISLAMFMAYQFFGMAFGYLMAEKFDHSQDWFFRWYKKNETWILVGSAMSRHVGYLYQNIAIWVNIYHWNVLSNDVNAAVKNKF